MLPQSTDDWALGLHSCRALSSQPQVHSTQKKSFFATFPLTNHIPALPRLLISFVWFWLCQVRFSVSFGFPLGFRPSDFGFGRLACGGICRGHRQGGGHPDTTTGGQSSSSRGIAGRLRPSPSPRPSPLGRGGFALRLPSIPETLGLRTRCRRFSLSPGERAGVRGNVQVSPSLLTPRQRLLAG